MTNLRVTVSYMQHVLEPCALKEINKPRHDGGLPTFIIPYYLIPDYP